MCNCKPTNPGMPEVLAVHPSKVNAPPTVPSSTNSSAGSRLRGVRGIYYPRGPFAADLQHLSLQRVQEKQWGQKERGYRMAVLTDYLFMLIIICVKP